MRGFDHMRIDDGALHYRGFLRPAESFVGLITYMRTDSTRLAAEATGAIRDYVKNSYGGKYCPEKPNVFANKNNAQDAHEAIRPTSVDRTPSEMEAHLTKEQYLLYKLIWERAVASQMTPAQYEQTTLTIGAAGYELKATGSVMVFDGYLRLADKKELNEEKQAEVPFIKSGTVLMLQKVLPGEQHFTEPPAHYTEASLVRKMEEEGIGRPSTYSPIIQTIQTRGYVVREGKKLMATELGVKVADMLTGYFGEIINIPYSAHMENELDAIAAKQTDKEKILADFYIPFEKLLEEADKVIPKDPPPLQLSGEKCELCGKDMVIREGRFGKFQACSGFPLCHNTKPLLVKIGVSCPKCGKEVTERRTRTGRVFYGCENYPECDFVSWDKPTSLPCPVCGKQLVERRDNSGNVKYFCSDPECENAAPKHVGRKKKVTTASLADGEETEKSGIAKQKKKAGRKPVTQKRTARKSSGRKKKE